MKLRTLKLFETEDKRKSKYHDEIVNLLREKCMTFINNNHANLSEGYFVYRGLTDDQIAQITKTKGFNRYYGIMQTRKDRKPKDNSIFMHMISNETLKKYGNIEWRTQSVFGTTSIYMAEDYGSAYVIFPIGDYDILYSEKIKDTIDINDFKKCVNFLDRHDPGLLNGISELSTFVRELTKIFKDVALQINKKHGTSFEYMQDPDSIVNKKSKLTVEIMSFVSRSFKWKESYFSYDAPNLNDINVDFYTPSYGYISDIYATDTATKVMDNKNEIDREVDQMITDKINASSKLIALYKVLMQKLIETCLADNYKMSKQYQQVEASIEMMIHCDEYVCVHDSLMNDELINDVLGESNED